VAEPNPYRDVDGGDAGGSVERGDSNGSGRAESNGAEPYTPSERVERAERPERTEGSGGNAGGDAPDGAMQQRDEPRRDEQRRDDMPMRDGNIGGGGGGSGGGRPHGGGRGPRRGGGGGGAQPDRGPILPVVADSETKGWFDLGRDGGYIRRAAGSYLAEPGDAFVPLQMVRQIGLRRGDLIEATTGRDQRGRTVVAEIKSVNGDDPANAARRPDFATLTASYPERKLFLETGRPAKGGAELIRRAIDLIAPIGFGQRALIVAPARAGKTTLLHAITEGVALNHPNAVLLILLVDERPEEVSEAISWGVGEVIASSFDQPAARHVEVTEIVLERARRLVEQGKDVVIVLDSLTRMARAHNTAERGTGRTLSGGLDAQAMAKPKAFFGSARAIPASAGGGSLTIIATALIETGSRMDDVIFEEFKGTGNSEIKLDRSLAEKRIYPAIDIATSGTRREEKLFRPDQLDAVYTLRRGLSQMPPQAGMEGLIKRIAGTQNNDSLLSGL
jgi:transcription termination factor Rho